MGGSQRRTRQVLIGGLSGRPDVRANVGALVAAVLFGASVVAVRVAVRDIPPTTLAVLRFGQGIVVLFALLSLTKPELVRVSSSTLRTCGSLGVIFFSFFPLSFNAGLQFTQASRGALMLATMPIWSMLLARSIVGERLVARQVVGIVVSLCGVAIVVAEGGLVLEGGARALLGDGLVLLTAFLGALYGVFAKRAMEHEHALVLVTYAMLIGTLVLVPFALAEGLLAEVGDLDPSLLGILVFLGIPGGAIAFGLWTMSLARLSPTQVAIYINLNPVVAATLGVLLLSERPTPTFVLSFVAVLGGVLLVNWPTKERAIV
jgi:drug/metabolite transporter (DMT)-like permease